MEEIKGTEALEREILEDAGKRAEKIIRKTREEVERLKSASAATIEDQLGQLKRKHLEKIAQLEKETASRLPLEKTRLRARFIDETMRKSVSDFLISLDSASLSAWCLSEFRKRVNLLSGNATVIRWKGIDADQIREMREEFPKNSNIKFMEDPAMSHRGIIAKTLDDTIIITLTEQQIEDWLLDEKRGELASALLPVATFEKIKSADQPSPPKGGEEGKI